MRKPTILDVNPDAHDLGWEADLLERLESHVLTCQGPRAPGACPILKGKPCPRVDKADGILFQLDLDNEDHRRILATYAERLDVPIRAVVRPEQRREYPELLSLVEVVEGPVGPAALDAFEAEVESELD